MMGTILTFLPRGVFDSGQTRVLGEAFDAVCAALHDTGQPDIVQEVIARRILAAARRGVKDPERLRDAALVAFEAADRP